MTLYQYRVLCCHVTRGFHKTRANPSLAALVVKDHIIPTTRPIATRPRLKTKEDSGYNYLAFAPNRNRCLHHLLTLSRGAEPLSRLNCSTWSAQHRIYSVWFGRFFVHYYSDCAFRIPGTGKLATSWAKASTASTGVRVETGVWHKASGISSSNQLRRWPPRR